ncbi:MAG TPA: hypothetical protein DDZ92_03900 [Halomonas sp.]|nr:hypothetical protein [Halomonas sp.]
MSLGLGLGLPFGRAKMIRFDPLTLFANGEQGAWHDPSDLSTLFQDSAGSTPVTAAGQPVGLMLDKSGRNNHARQTTAAARPLYQIDAGKPYLAFDGVDDFMVTTAFDWGSDEAFIGVGVRANTIHPGIIFETSVDAPTTNGTFRLFSAAANAGRYGAGVRGITDSATTYNPNGIPGTNYVGSLVGTTAGADRAANLAWRLNGLAQTESQSLSTGPAGGGSFGNHPLYIGTRAGTSLPFNGRIYGAILRNLNPDTATIEAIEQYLAAKAGVILP